MSTRITLVLLVAVIVSAVTAGLMVVGSPSTERERRLDEQRIRHLRDAVAAIDRHWSQTAKLPTTLAPAFNVPEGSPPPSDPVTGQRYSFTVLDTERYELCAVFQQPSEREGGFWTHGVGHTCFTIRVKSVPSSR